jgi:carbamoyl-phosphate synthase/aspartate carbamoyltransferase/dihydroorotase
MIRLPALIDPHVHVREPGATQKEDWDSATAAALAGGITTILAMPNTQPPVTDSDTLEMALMADNLDVACQLAPRTAGLKMYLDQTYGPLRLDDMALWMEHFRQWPRRYPIVAHAEGRTMAAVILLAAIYDRPVHIAHVARREEILLIQVAKSKGIPVTCEVTPHHLFLTEQEIPSLGAGRSEVRPRLATAGDQLALWEHLEVIDCFATDHAPHTLEEKDREKPPPGFPGLETALPLFMTAIHEGRLTIQDLINKMSNRPREIFNIPEQPESWVEIDPEVNWEIHAASTFTRCGWTPFEGWKVRGRLRRVILRNVEVYRDGKVMAQTGYGRNVRQIE